MRWPRRTGRAMESSDQEKTSSMIRSVAGLVMQPQVSLRTFEGAGAMGRVAPREQDIPEQGDLRSGRDGIGWFVRGETLPERTSKSA